MLQWTTEEKVLLDIKKIISIVRRMNSQQLHSCSVKLNKQFPEKLSGQLGRVFLKRLNGISFQEAEATTKMWQQLLWDVDRMLKLMQKYRNSDEKVWERALFVLEARQDKIFHTELGRAFILTLKEKLGYEELERVANWLMEEPPKVQCRGQEKQRKLHRYLASFPDGGVIALLACMSLSFFIVWMYGQMERNQNFYNVRKLKAAAVTQQQSFKEKPCKTEQKTTDYVDNQMNKEKVDYAENQANRHVVEQSADLSKRPKILVQYRNMAKEYPGLFGWLQIPDTQIDLPVMQPLKEEDFYLQHDFTGVASAEGALFTDPENNRWPQDDNTVIYGHNMKNGHIFGTLNLYENADYFQNHKEIHFDTIYETGIYEAVAILKTRILNKNERGFRYYQFFKYDNEKEFQECLDFVIANQLFDTGSRLKYGDKILMLSTCEYSRENGRLVIVARKVENEDS